MTYMLNNKLQQFCSTCCPREYHEGDAIKKCSSNLHKVNKLCYLTKSKNFSFTLTNQRE